MTSRETLVLYVAGLLNPPDEAEVADRLASSPALRRRLARIRRPAASASAGWCLPPPGLGMPLTLPGHEVLSVVTVQSGACFHMELPDRDDAAAREVVVLRREAGRWEVLAPRRADERARLDEFSMVGKVRRITLVARGAGPQRWAVALPPWREERDPAAPDAWADLILALEAGEVPVGSVDVEVR